MLHQHPGTNTTPKGDGLESHKPCLLLVPWQVIQSGKPRGDLHHGAGCRGRREQVARLGCREAPWSGSLSQEAQGPNSHLAAQDIGVTVTRHLNIR